MKRFLKAFYRNFGWKWWIYTALVFLLTRGADSSGFSPFAMSLIIFFAFVGFPWLVVWIINRSTDRLVNRFGKSDGEKKRPHVFLWIWTVVVFYITIFTELPKNTSRMTYILIGCIFMIGLPWLLVWLNRFPLKKKPAQDN